MKRWCFVTLLWCAPAVIHAQMNMGGPVETLKENVLRHTSSGTSLEPDSSAPPMVMRMSGRWMEMLHGEASVAEQQQDRKSTRLNSSHESTSRMPSSA